MTHEISFGRMRLQKIWPKGELTVLGLVVIVVKVEDNVLYRGAELWDVTDEEFSRVKTPSSLCFNYKRNEFFYRGDRLLIL